MIFRIKLFSCRLVIMGLIFFSGKMFASATCRIASSIFDQYTFHAYQDLFFQIRVSPKNRKKEIGEVTFFKDSMHGSILSIQVDEKHGEKGLGSILLQLALQKLSCEGCSQIELSPVPLHCLTVQEYQKRLCILKSWYGKFGFQVDERAAYIMVAKAPFALSVVAVPQCEFTKE